MCARCFVKSRKLASELQFWTILVAFRGWVGGLQELTFGMAFSEPPEDLLH